MVANKTLAYQASSVCLTKLFVMTQKSQSKTVGKLSPQNANKNWKVLAKYSSLLVVFLKKNPLCG